MEWVSGHFLGAKGSVEAGLGLPFLSCSMGRLEMIIIQKEAGEGCRYLPAGLRT